MTSIIASSGLCVDSPLLVLLPPGLAVDYFNERLYWADAKLSVIGSVHLNGSDPVIAVTGLKNSSVPLHTDSYGFSAT